MVTEFSPNVSWGGAFNVINGDAGAHMSEAGWLRGADGNAVLDSISRFWVQPNGWQPEGPGTKPVWYHYYYWYATALKRNFDKTGNTTLLKNVLSPYKAQFLTFTTGAAPGGQQLVVPIDQQGSQCLYNVPGNDAQEGAISGPGCRPLVQSTMYGEAAALAELFAAIGDEASAAEMAAEACKWQTRVLQQWNANLSSFDTIHPPIPPMPSGWNVLPNLNSTHCNATFLYQGFQLRAACVEKCSSTANCHFMTYNYEMDWCQLYEYCNSTVNTGGLGLATMRTWQKPTGAFGANVKRGMRANNNSDDSSDVWTFAGVRELASLTSPWMFSVVPHENASLFANSWDTAFDPEGLGGPHGLRTAEKRHPDYFCDAGCCSWAGPVWPYETSKGIQAAINVLNNYPEVTTLDGFKFWTLLADFTAMHTPKWRVMATGSTFYSNLTDSPLAQYLMDGLGELWIAENGCGDDQWTKQPQLGGPAWTDVPTNGYRYNHCTFMDLVLSGVVGLQPQSNGTLVVNPLVPATILPWWAADGIALHLQIVTVVFDADGSHYNAGAGLRVMVNGVTVASSPTLRPLTVHLTPAPSPKPNPPPPTPPGPPGKPQPKFPFSWDKISVYAFPGAGSRNFTDAEVTSVRFTAPPAGWTATPTPCCAIFSSC